MTFIHYFDALYDRIIMIYVIITLPHATVCWSELNNFVYIFNLAHTSHFIVQIG